MRKSYIALLIAVVFRFIFVFISAILEYRWKIPENPIINWISIGLLIIAAFWGTITWLYEHYLRRKK